MRASTTRPAGVVGANQCRGSPRHFCIPTGPRALAICARFWVAIEVCGHSVTTRSAHPTQLGGGRAKPCRLVVLSGNTCPERKLRRAHTHGVDRGKAPRATNTSCVTEIYLPASKASRRHSRLTLLSHPFPSDPRKTLPRLLQRTLGKPSPDSPNGPSENPPQTPSWDPRKALFSGPTGLTTRRTAGASNTALRRGGGKGAT